MSEPTINQQKVADPTALEALRAVLDDDDFSEYHNGDTNFTEAELGAILDCRDRNDDVVDNRDLSAHKLLVSGLSNEQVTALAEEYRTRFPDGSKTIRIMQDPEVALEAMQHEFVLSYVGEGQPRYIQTSGAGPCVILTLYDAETKTGLIAHFDVNTDVAASFELMSDIRDSAGTNIFNRMEARLIGGWPSSSADLVTALNEQLEAAEIKVIEDDTLPAGHGFASVTLDTETGEIYFYSETQHTRLDEDFDKAALIAQTILDGAALVFYAAPEELTQLTSN